MNSGVPRPPFAVVRWLDAHENEEDMTPDQARANHVPLEMVSCGFLVRRDSAGVSLAMDYVAEQQGTLGFFRCVHFIPAGMIRSIRVRR